MSRRIKLKRGVVHGTYIAGPFTIKKGHRGWVVNDTRNPGVAVLRGDTLDEACDKLATHVAKEKGLGCECRVGGRSACPVHGEPT